MDENTERAFDETAPNPAEGHAEQSDEGHGEHLRQCDICHRWFPESELHLNRVGRTLDGRLESLEYLCDDCLEKR